MLRSVVQRFKKKIINLVKNLFENFGISIVSKSTLTKIYLELTESRRSFLDLKFLEAIPNTNLPLIFSNLKDSKSQLRQDLFVLSELNFKRNGFFVEFGATNGIDLSNTYLLEKNYGWTGILSEPAKIWISDIQANRPNSSFEPRCVWSESNLTLKFNETKEPELSTINHYSENDGHYLSRKSGNYYDVLTISLKDLLNKHEAPPYIDYLSIDTEGSEFEILNAFDFKHFTFGIITCEHNFTESRSKVFDLLRSHGYERKFEEVSLFDDWYVKVK